MNNQYSKFTLAPNATHRIAGTARFFRFVEGSAGGADSTILVQPVGGGDAVLLRPGQGFDTSQFDRVHSDWIISNYLKQGTIVGTVMLGDIRLDDDRITGSVEVIDGGKFRTMAGAAFMGYTGMAAGVGLYSHTQLWNPPGSGKLLIVEQVTTYADSASAAVVTFENVQAATLGMVGISKIQSGAASIAELRKEQKVTRPASGLVAISTGGISQFFKPAEPFIINPGSGLTIYGAGANVAVTSSFEWYEESV